MTQFLNTQINNYSKFNTNQPQTNSSNQPFSNGNYGVNVFSNAMRNINNNEVNNQKSFDNFNSNSRNTYYMNNVNSNQNQNYSPWGQPSNKNNPQFSNDFNNQNQNFNKVPFSNSNNLNLNQNKTNPQSGKSIWASGQSNLNKMDTNSIFTTNPISNPVSIFTSSAFNLNKGNISNANSIPMTSYGNQNTKINFDQSASANKTKLTGKDIFLLNKIVNPDNSIFSAKNSTAISNETEMDIANGEANSSNIAQSDLLNLNFQFLTDSNANRNQNLTVSKNIFEKKGDTSNKPFDVKNIFGAFTTSAADDIHQANENKYDIDIEMDMDVDNNEGPNAQKKIEQIDNKINSSDNVSDVNKMDSQRTVNKPNTKIERVEEKKLTFEETFRKEYGLLSILD